jgi:hypothetical protein
VAFEGLAFAPGGLTLYVVTDLESDFLHLRRLDVASGTWETLLAPNWDVETMALAPTGAIWRWRSTSRGSRGWS